MKKNLIIVESPTKAKTITKFLGRGYKVMSSFGHVRDLPKNDLGVDTENDFAPKYVIPTKSRKVASELKKAVKDAEIVYFASDEDREGEAISWHLKEMLDIDPKRTKRITFHEITGTAIKKALENPRDIDNHLVDAQQARRVLDRLVGYKLSPFLWRKVARGLSAGRVQSVVVRLIVEREREIGEFKPQEYWSVEATLHHQDGTESFVAKLHQRDGKTLDKFALADEGAAQKVLNDLDGSAWTVKSVEKKTVKKKPLPPFTTSTLQQDANNRFGFSSKQTMVIAQQLYEGIELGDDGSTGLITYMRTDSVNLSDNFVGESRDWLAKNLGNEYLPNGPRRYENKSKGAQEAHEAIRPTGASLHPEIVSKYLDSHQAKLYDLIWRRAMASQMVDAEIDTVTVDAEATEQERPTYDFRATGSILVKKGYLEVYQSETKENLLPELNEGDGLQAEKIELKQHFTEPPPRYTEASLVKTLEENGIGRPSTYAPTISTVVDRGYVEKDGRKLKPTDLATLVNDLLVQHFPNVVDLQFTAKMEDDLDDVAAGRKDWVPVIRDFYLPFEENLKVKEKEVNKKDVAEESTDEKCEHCGKPMVIKMGRYGKFMACTGFPECRNTKAVDGADGDATAEAVPETDQKCEACGSPMIVKRGRFGPFLSCSGYPKCKTIKSIQKKVGVNCPQCGEGEIVEKKTRKGKTFYACSGYPKCDFALWSRPTGDTCPKCKQLMVMAKKDEAKCSGEGCGYVQNTSQSE
ncbi:type I DNA topoisomerase [Candidatus Uhrbacteria bacterium CG_4_10_14_0_8_um_filter_58_22]|uniref:DNA topoisomerase 1 n=1 Tax=Candidatus Uhrbacteria bacterium CG_4_10_14_0_8_um_filter_58_22 TaxID=1975029 RepID=A0A2M7QB42_9BACT|nr:MAG: type I DNA topoisomerase [Candidatus Uhrbacteria bacterium CG_4_10_14_0_8_um_filter_58_22]